MRAFVFPGQASQKVGMGDWLIEQYDEAREVYELADEALGYKLSQVILEGPMEKLTETEVTQPAVLTTSVAYDRVLRKLGHTPDVVAGHSLGEYSALVSAGAVDFADAVRAVRDRGRYMQDAVPLGEGMMQVVFRMEAAQIDEVCAAVREETGGEVRGATYNAPGLIVISGDRPTVTIAGEKLKELKGNVSEIPVSAPFHCTLMKPAAQRLAERLGEVTFSDPAVPYLPNVTAEPETDGGKIYDNFVAQVEQPVRWEQTVRRLLAMGVDEFYEVGPGNVLCGFIRRVDRAQKPVPVSDPKGKHLFE
jgi:[acyl-carrier-protein] S-malonyltransferase